MEMIPMLPNISKAVLLVISTVAMAGGGNPVRFSPSSPSVFSSWKAPASAANKKNPIPISAASIQAGQSIFTQNCEACHGSDGKGDGPTGAFLNPHPANLTKASFWAQGEGAIFWKITHGHSPMPSFRDSLSHKQRWEVIDYMRHQFDKGK
jgi:mono/diheme cytochrome c family protein